MDENVRSEGVDDRRENPEGEIVYQNPVLVGVVLLIAGISVAMIQYKVPTIMTDMMAMFSMSAEAASWLMSIFTLMGVFVALPSGMLAQRFGAKKMMIVAAGIAVLGSMLGLFSGTSALLIASRAVEGAALTVLTTCGPIVIQQCVKPDSIGTSMGIWGIWGCLGSTVAAVVTPTIFENLGFEGLWIVFAVVTSAAAVLVAIVIRVPKKGHALVSEDSASVREAQEGKPKYRALLTYDIAFFFVGFVMFNVCLLAILSFVPTILQMQGFDPTLSGFISTAPMLLSILSSPLFGVVSDKIGRCKPLLVSAMLVMGPCTFLLYTQTGAVLWAAVALMGLVGMGGVGMFLAGYTKLLPGPQYASVGMGVLVLMQGVGQFLGSFLVQLLLGPSLSNFYSAGVVLMILGLTGAVALLFCRMK